MMKIPIIALQLDLTFGFPVLVGARLEWCDATWVDVLLVIGAGALIAL